MAYMKNGDLTGRIYNHLMVIRFHPAPIGRWECLCSCGNIAYFPSSVLVSGRAKSCGHVKVAETHGMTRTLIYKRWSSMRSRCKKGNNAKTNNNYFLKGVKVCSEWDTFETYYKDMGDIPFNGAEIDRIDNAKGYSKENCRWTTRKENNRNKSTNRSVVYEGKLITTVELSEITGVKQGTIHNRLDKGLDINSAILLGRRPLKSERCISNSKGETFKNVSEAARHYGVVWSTVHGYLNKGFKPKNGLTWFYVK